jgi:hypothetical protein
LNTRGVTGLAESTIAISVPKGAQEYLWSNGATDAILTPDVSGSYAVEARFECTTLISDTVDVEILNPNAISVQNDTILVSGSGVLIAIGDSILWYDDPLGSAVKSGPIYVTPLVDTTTTYYVQQVQTILGGPSTVGPLGHTGNTMYNSNMSNGAIRFNVVERFRLDSVHVYTAFSGERTVIIMDVFSDTIYNETFQIDSGDIYLSIDTWLEVGDDYVMTTDGSKNQVTFGGISPRLIRSDGGISYPFVVPETVEIVGTATSQQFYYYFYDWHLTREDHYCVGDLIPVQVVVMDSTSGIFNPLFETLELMPNPASDELTIRSIEYLSHNAQISVHDAQGRKVSGWSMDKSAGRLFVRNLPQGMYIVRMDVDDRTLIGKFVKM